MEPSSSRSSETRHTKPQHHDIPSETAPPSRESPKFQRNIAVSSYQQRQHRIGPYQHHARDNGDIGHDKRRFSNERIVDNRSKNQYKPQKFQSYVHNVHNPNLSSFSLPNNTQSTARQHGNTFHSRSIQNQGQQYHYQPGRQSGNHHPLHHNVNSPIHRGQGTHYPSQIVHGSQDLLSQPQLDAATLHTLRIQGQRFVDTLVGWSSKKNRVNIDLSAYNTSKIFLIFPIVILMIISPYILDRTTRYPEFQWSPGRKLNNRQCTLNYFIEKQKPNEYNPDYKEIIINGTVTFASPELEEGTHRTKGQIDVISRFIGSVADSFRSNVKIQQHLIFTGSRDGGDLAERALKYWPPRGGYKPQIHIISDEKVLPSDKMSQALDYGALAGIEERFQDHANNENVHIYDSKGNKAGYIPSSIDDDDVYQLRSEEMFGSFIDDDEINNDLDLPYPSLTKLLAPYFEDEYDDESVRSISEGKEQVIPYFHVDGMSASQQFEILESAKPLFEDNTIVTVGIENSADIDVNELIDFFRSVNYKTFFLGLRQVARIDHLCPEILEDIMRHNYITPPNPNFLRKFLQVLRIIPQEKNEHLIHPQKGKLKFPPFFIAMPRGRSSKEEMTIQHMYDLFGGHDGGGGQIATANDRKAPGKK